jgi:hypothetical protein
MSDPNFSPHNFRNGIIEPAVEAIIDRFRQGDTENAIDEAFGAVDWAVCRNAERYFLVPGTLLRVAHTRPLHGLPAFAVFFRIYDSGDPAVGNKIHYEAMTETDLFAPEEDVS